MSQLKPNEPCWCNSSIKYKKCHKPQILKKGNVSPERKVPAHIKLPDYAFNPTPERKSSSFIASPDVIKRMRVTCQAARRVLKKTIKAVKPGITTDELDAIAHDACIAEGGYPSPLNYRGFPKSICTSVNEVICHGVPDDRPLKHGDIINIDVTLYMNGVHGDCSEMALAGDVNEVSRKLVKETFECLMLGISAVKPDAQVKDIGKKIEEHAKKCSLDVVRAYCGHGIGESFHNNLLIPHYYDPDNRFRLKEGMIFTIEPMINTGDWQHSLWSDCWTAVTRDLKPSAQYEHTVLVTENGVEILTLLPEEK
ncbi:MAG: type I methionyl aminopeptidase [bacterium]|nr:type I methionyl aminopeptidase [bacterium]